MRFSWKICLSTVLISLIVFSVGGYILINALFKSTYENEMKNALEENRMLQNSLVAYWSTSADETVATGANVKKIAQSLVNTNSDDGIRIRVSNERMLVYYDNSGVLQYSDLLEAVDSDTRAYMLVDNEGTYELITAGAIVINDDELLYLESVRDITEVFRNRDGQYKIYRLWLMGMLLAETILCYLITLWQLRQLHNLSRAAERLSDGDLKVRAKITGHDELGRLTQTFNHMADNLEQQFLEIEDYARRQEDFIGSFAHELKTPLTSIIGYADMMCTRELKEEERFQAANYIYKEGKRLEALSLKLLDLMVVKNEEPVFKPVYTKWWLSDIEGILKPVLTDAGISLKMNVEDEQVMMEPDLMKTVILNLLDNSRKAIEGEGFIYLSGKNEAYGYAIYVRDTGKGMPEEEISHITEAFYMVDKSRARKQGGAGLGLSICAEIVKLHKGSLEFKSKEGKGTVVRLLLPMGEDR